jgi:hypothetical protein
LSKRARRRLSAKSLLFHPLAFWQRAAKESRFAFRSPDLAVAAIEAAVKVPDAKRVQAILMAAASGFRIRGLQDVLDSLRKTLDDMTVITAQEHQ